MTGAAADRRTLWLVALAIVAATALCYAQVRDHRFLSYDDDQFLVDNPAIQHGLDAAAVRWAFTNNHASLWLPVTWISHTLDFALFGDDAGAHHLVNLALHLLNAVLMLLVCVHLTGRLWPSALVAALFALHPLHVESVAWVTERKDTLSTLFLLLTIGAYARWVRGGSRAASAAAVVCFALGLMAKPMLVTVPVLLLVLDRWPLARGAAPGRLLREKIPFAALAAGVGAVTILVGRAGGIVAGLEALPVWPRLANALVSTAAYPLKMVWPAGLRAQYVFRGDLPPGDVLLAAVLLAAVTFAAVRWRRTGPWFAAGWAWYLVALIPVSGVLQQGSHAMADRYTYVPLLGLYGIVAWGGAELVAGSALRRRLAWVAALGVLAALGVATHRQAATWRDSVTLFSHAVEVAPDDPLARTYLGVALAATGRHTDAADQFRRALEIKPGDPQAHFHLARSLAALGDDAGAARHYEACLPAYGDSVAVRFDLGTHLMRAGQPEDAVAAFERVLELDPAHTGALTNLGLTLLGLGRHAEALVFLRRLVAAIPDDPLAHYNLACGLSVGGDTAGSAAALAQAITLGYADWDHMASDPDLANLRDTPAFARLVALGSGRR